MNIECLELKNKYKSIYVNRQGNVEDSYMITLSIINEIFPDKTYQILDKSITELNKKEELDKNTLNKKKELDKNRYLVPKNIIIKGEWNNKIKLSYLDSNILGDNGVFITNDDYIIPVAETTNENLAYYNVSLYKIGDIINFETTQTLPITIVKIGKNYVNGYIYPIGGGIYCEKHNTPHYHQPISPESKGYLIIGKEIKGGLQLSAFTIPYGYGIYMPPYTIHNDLFLEGTYLVVYTKAEEYSTVLFRKDNNKAVKISIGN